MDDKEIVEHIKCYKAAKLDTEKDEIVGKLKNMKIEQFKYLLQFGPKNDWWVQSEILIALGYPYIEPILDKLFEWLKDMNWPGALDIQEQILLKIDKTELVSSLDSALHVAYGEGDSEWIYWLTIFAEKANISRNDFSQCNNAYDIILLYDAIYVDDCPTFDYIKVLRSWGYPRIIQFIFYVVSVLRIEKPYSAVWEQHVEILNMVPEDVRATKLKEVLRQLHEIRGINSIGHLKEIIPIGDSIEDFQKYIYS